MYTQDIHPSHDLGEIDFGAPGWTPVHAIAACLYCGLTTCPLCPAGSPLDAEGMAEPCAKAPASGRPEPRRLELEVVKDPIPGPPRKSTVTFSSGTAWIPGGGGALQIGSGAITFTLGPGSYMVPADRLKDLADRLDELIRKGRQAEEDISKAIQSGVFWAAKPAEDP